MHLASATSSCFLIVLSFTSGLSFFSDPFCAKRHLFLSFPYVCPEPVLVK
jgi:hypothetical protein